MYMVYFIRNNIVKQLNKTENSTFEIKTTTTHEHPS